MRAKYYYRLFGQVHIKKAFAFVIIFIGIFILMYYYFVNQVSPTIKTLCDTRAKAIAPKPAGIVDEEAAITDSVKWTPETIASASINDLANGVLNGEFGNYTDRKTALGNRYNEVQTEVNNRLRRHKQGGQIMKYFHIKKDILFLNTIMILAGK